MVPLPGYQRAIIPNLAIELAPLYNKNVGPTLTRNASLRFVPFVA